MKKINHDISLVLLLSAVLFTIGGFVIGFMLFPFGVDGTGMPKILLWIDGFFNTKIPFLLIPVIMLCLASVIAYRKEKLFSK
ncbi:hypothetical protein ACFO26_09295 [Lactococcus nasutitermitis]|uniref:Uncharacterized protein n=1 Tax=Lactococcus nasutitermitis TaxID=1652957 RepID=A0ABV9JF58_9LACT|nr:hypothetical protein [Lactococcus nasutitermitis]